MKQRRYLLLLVALACTIGLSCPAAWANCFDLGEAGPDQWAFLALGGGDGKIKILTL